MTLQNTGLKKKKILWDLTDPLKRLKQYLLTNKLWKEEEELSLLAEYKKEIDRQFSEAENFATYAWKTFLIICIPKCRMI